MTGTHAMQITYLPENDMLGPIRSSGDSGSQLTLPPPPPQPLLMAPPSSNDTALVVSKQNESKSLQMGPPTSRSIVSSKRGSAATRVRGSTSVGN